VDADGETTSMQRAGTTYSFTYNARQRMATAQDGAGTPVAYTYNALGERIRKTANTTVTDRFQYDEASHLLSRSRTDGTRDYIWLGSLPVAVVDQPAANGVSTESYVIADDLGSPRVVTDASGTQIWSWAKQGNPFGEQQPTSGSGFVFDMRFPGQNYDVESGLTYNTHRDYRATTGQYMEPDPLGLLAGESLYTYVDSNPIVNKDPMGLCKAKGRWVQVGWVRGFNIQCLCTWIWISSGMPTMWSGNPHDMSLPKTVGVLVNDGGGGVKRGSGCLCAPPPIPDK
jgi:RHS repeat-associated protein